MEKIRNTSTESPLPLMCSDRYPNCLKERKIIFSVLYINVLFLKGISCSVSDRIFFGFILAKA